MREKPSVANHTSISLGRGSIFGKALKTLNKNMLLLGGINHWALLQTTQTTRETTDGTLICIWQGMCLGPPWCLKKSASQIQIALMRANRIDKDFCIGFKSSPEILSKSLVASDFSSYCGSMTRMTENLLGYVFDKISLQSFAITFHHDFSLKSGFSVHGYYCAWQH